MNDDDDDDDDDVLKYNKLSYHKQVALCVIKQHNKLTISPDEYDNRQSGIDFQHSHLRTLPVTSADNIRSICPTDIADIICVCPHFTRWNIRRSAHSHFTRARSVLTFVAQTFMEVNKDKQKLQRHVRN